MILESAGIRLSELPANIERTPVIIFGAGHLGVQLLEALRRGYNRTAVAFIDTEPSLWRQYVSGLKVHHPDKLPMLIARHQVKEVLVAMPDERRRERRRRAEVSAAAAGPGEDAAGDGGHRHRPRDVSDLRPVDVEDLLGRDPVPPDADLLARNDHGQVGAGDRRRRLDRLGAGAPDPAQAPRRLVLLDVSRSGALRDRGSEIDELLQSRRARARAGCRAGGRRRCSARCSDGDLRAATIEQVRRAGDLPRGRLQARADRRAQCGVRACATTRSAPPSWPRARERCGVERFVLISTDKAVRPTNVMGASKRLAELVLQAARRQRHGPHRLHHGALRQRARQLGLGGALFRQQIQAGGPVTVTHPTSSATSCRSRRRRSSSSRPAPWRRAATCSCSTWASRCKIDDLARLDDPADRASRCATRRQPRGRHRHRRIRACAPARSCTRSCCIGREHHADGASAHLALG